MTNTSAEDDNDQSLINIDYFYRAASGGQQIYKEAMNSLKAHQWTEAMQEEIESLKENDVFFFN